MMTQLLGIGTEILDRRVVAIKNDGGKPVVIAEGKDKSQIELTADVVEKLIEEKNNEN